MMLACFYLSSKVIFCGCLTTHKFCVLGRNEYSPAHSVQHVAVEFLEGVPVEQVC